MNLFASQMMKPVVLISEIDVKYYWRERQKDDRAIYVYVETYKQSYYWRTIGATIERPETRRRAGARCRGTNVRLSRKRY